jgi:ComF family protein
MLAQLDWVRAAYPFAGALREAIHRFKYGKERARAAPLAAACVPLLDQLPRNISQSPPLLIPVPLSAARRRERGYNQAEALARALGAECAWPLSTALARIRATPPQVGLTPTARRANVRDAFAWQGESLAGRPVLLIDDVLTTGATANECAAVLKAAGAAWVGLLTVARAGDGR